MKAERPLRDGVPSADETRQALERVLARHPHSGVAEPNPAICGGSPRQDRSRERIHNSAPRCSERGASFDPQTILLYACKRGGCVPSCCSTTKQKATTTLFGSNFCAAGTCLTFQGSQRPRAHSLRSHMA